MTWVWESRSAGACVARGLLWGPSLAYRAASAARVRAYRTGVLPSHRADRPVIAVGNLTVGGVGKTPIAAWIASTCAGRGITPGIVLRGYGGDEGPLHRALTPAARVVESADRVAGARRAVQLGARILILDDGFQRLDVLRDLDLVVVSAESLSANRALLPAGPWREPWRALARADLVIISRKRATRTQAAAAAAQAAALMGDDRVVTVHLGITGFETLRTARAVTVATVACRNVLAVCGIGDPASFAAQLAAFGAHVRLWARRDHSPYRAGDVRRLLSAAREVDYVVVTAKDALKLRRIWPEDAPELLVATLGVHWEDKAARLVSALNAVLATT